MGFPDRVIVGRTEDENAFQGGLHLEHKGQAFEQINASNLMQLLAQLIDARRFAQEIFTELAAETVKTSQRLRSVSDRVHQVSQVVPGIQRIFHETSPDCFLLPSSVKLERNSNIRGGIFIRRGAPQKVDRRRHDAIDPPDLNALNKFSKALDLSNIKKTDEMVDETNLRCGDKYSLPQFFFQQWLEQESEKHRIRKEIRKKRKAERRAARKARKAEKEKYAGSKVSKVRKKYVDQFGNIYFKEVGGDINIEERSGVKRQNDAQVTSLNYGAKEMDFNQNYGTSAANAGTWEVGKHQPTAPAQPMADAPATLSAIPNIPPPVVHTNPNHVHVAMPDVPRPPAHVQPPPVHHTTNHGGPPMPPGFHPPTQPPRQPVHTPAAPPQQPAAPAIPGHMAPYAKMKKFGLGEWQIKGKMKTNGHDPDDYDRYFGDGAPAPTAPTGGSRPPSNPHGSAPPPNPRARPNPQPARRAVPTGSLMDAIRGGAKLKTAPTAPKPAPTTGRGGMMSMIRAGAKLKKTSKLPPMAPRELTGQDAVMAAIRKNAKGGLKKASARKLKEKEPDAESGDIFALLRLREKIADSDTEDSDSGSWDSD